MMAWTPISNPPVIPYIHEEEYGFMDVEVQLADGKICKAEYTYQKPNYFWMVDMKEDSGYFWDDTINLIKFPESPSNSMEVSMTIEKVAEEAICIF